MSKGLCQGLWEVVVLAGYAGAVYVGRRHPEGSVRDSVFPSPIGGTRCRRQIFRFIHSQRPADVGSAVLFLPGPRHEPPRQMVRTAWYHLSNWAVAVAGNCGVGGPQPVCGAFAVEAWIFPPADPGCSCRPGAVVLAAFGRALGGTPVLLTARLLLCSTGFDVASGARKMVRTSSPGALLSLHLAKSLATHFSKTTSGFIINKR